MGLDAFNQLLIHGLAIACCAECAVIAETARAACNLRRFHGGQITPPPSVIFGQACKGDMVRIEIQPHAHGVCRDKKIHFARLKQLGLRIAGARRQTAHHHSRASAKAPDELGDGVNFGRAERHDDRAFGQAGEFGGAVIMQF